MSSFKSRLTTAFHIIFIPSYSVLATLLALSVLWLILWLFNFNLLVTVLGSPKVMGDEKISFALAPFHTLFTNFNPGVAVGLIVFSALYGAGFSILLYLIRHGRRRH